MTRPVDWATEERKLQPVFDDIQQGRIKPAQAAVDRWLKKHPKSQPALVARMVVTDASGQGRDAVLKAYEEVQKTAPLTPRSIWRVSTVLRSIRCPELVMEMFQALWDQHPEVPDFADQVFFEASAMGNTSTMASTSRKIFNLQKIPARARLAAYSAWADTVPSPTDAEPFPSVSDPAVAKALLPAQLLIRTTGSDVPTAETLWLRLQVALGAGDVTEAWRLVREDGRKGALSRRWFGMEAAVAIAKRNDPAVPAATVWADEFEATSALLRKDKSAQHNYAFYRHLLASVAGAEESEREERAQKAAAVFRDLVVEVGEKERSPLLALLELDKAEAEDGRGMPEDEWASTVSDYLERWGGKWTAESEMAGIAGTHGTALKAIMEKAAARPHSDVSSYCARAVAELYLQHHTEAPKPSMEEAQRLWALYTEGLEYGRNLPPTDPQPADPIGMAAVSVLGRFWASSPSDEAPLQHAAECLEAIVKASPSSYPAHFTLCRVCRLLGAPSLYAPHLKRLGLSEIQLDNLLHVVSERGALEAFSARTIDQWQQHADRASDMYGRSVTDLPNYIKQALQHETYSKIHGMRALIRALERSVAQRVLEVEEIALALSTGGTVLESTVECLATALKDDAPFVDNRNFELMADGFIDAPAPTMDEATVRSLGAALLGITSILLACPKQPPALPTDRTHLSPADRAFVDAVDLLLRATASAAPEAGAEATEAPPVGGLYDAAIAAVLEAQTTWARSDAYLSLARLTGVARAIERHVAERAGPAKKGKKRPAGLVQLAVGLRTAREALPKRLVEVNTLLSKEAQWAQGGLVADEELVADISGKVKEARAALVASVASLVTLKQ